MKALLFCTVILFFAPVYGQIWKYPFAPFEYSYEADTTRKGIRSVAICSVMQDYTDCFYAEFDLVGRTVLNTEYSDCQDTTRYEYGEPGNPNWTRAVSSGGAIVDRTFERDARGNLTRLITTRNGISTAVMCTYNEAGQPLKAVYNDSVFRMYTYAGGQIATVSFFTGDRLKEKITVSFSGDTIAYVDCHYDEKGRQYPGERVRGVFRNGHLTELYTDYAWFTEESDWTPEQWGNLGSSFMKIDYTPRGDWEGYWDVGSQGNEGGIKGYCNDRGDVVKQELFSQGHHHANVYFSYEYYE